MIDMSEGIVLKETHSHIVTGFFYQVTKYIQRVNVCGESVVLACYIVTGTL